MKTIEQIEKEIETRSVKYRVEHVYCSAFAYPSVVKQAERKKARLENAGWILLKTLPGMLTYVKERESK